MQKQIAQGWQVISCYEAGPFGYGLHRQLTALGVTSHVIRPRNWDAEHKRVKGSWKLVCTTPPQRYNLADDLAETKDLATEKPELIAELMTRRERLITRGRSTPGAPQTNDVPVKRLAEAAVMQALRISERRGTTMS